MFPGAQGGVAAVLVALVRSSSSFAVAFFCSAPPFALPGFGQLLALRRIIDRAVNAFNIAANDGIVPRRTRGDPLGLAHLASSKSLVLAGSY